ncbi:IS66 family transposase [Butyrivibrio fibrisolvens]|uniref:IS66 family transposase n=1 Tax=Butyrivibrio fibrisolvens TaxID=831 RepID=UPI0004124612|nr:IS66 family transposase [Butyrivibrio fibrisolvens]
MSASKINPTTEKPTEYQSDETMNARELKVLLSQVMELNRSLQATVDNQTSTIAELTRELEWFRRNMFGKKAETSKRFDDYGDSDMHQMSLFDSMSEEQKLMLGITDVKQEERITVDSYKRTKTERKKKRTREELLANAKKGDDKRIYASDKEKICDLCESEMVHFGWEYVRTEVEHIPEEIIYHEVYVEKLICKNCKEEDDLFITKCATAPPALIPHSFATPSLIAFVGYQKYQMGVPNYRLEKHFERKGILISRACMASWLIWTAENIFFIPYEIAHQLIKNRFIVNADETTAPVNKIVELEPLADENGNPLNVVADVDYVEIRKECEAESADETDDTDEEKNKAISGRQNCYMWIFASVYGTDKPLILYEYQPSRGGYNCRNFLGADFSGYLMTDGFSGYNKMENAKRLTCADHVRRKWFEAIRNKSGPLNYEDPAVVGFMAINKIYQEENLLKGLDPDIIKVKRLEKEKPNWDAFKEWLEKLDPAGGSALRKAVNYTLNNWDKLMRYLEDGRLPLSNAAAERCAKSYATIRKNMLFHDTSRGARSAAIIKSLIDTAAANNLDPELYLTELLEHARDFVNEPARAAEYMPWTEKMQERCMNKTRKEDLNQ